MKHKKITCPICKKETTWDGNKFRPFCSERCRQMDLGKWASEEYYISGEKRDIPDEDDKDKE